MADPTAPHPACPPSGTHLLAAHADGLPEHDPGDALQQRRCGQRAGVGPVVQAPGEEPARVEASEGGALTLAQATLRLEPMVGREAHLTATAAF